MAVACLLVCTAASAVGYYLRVRNQAGTASLRSRRDFPYRYDLPVQIRTGIFFELTVLYESLYKSSYTGIA